MTSSTTTPEVAHHRLDDMVRGWFVGAFTPTALHAEGFEVAVQRFRAGDVEAEHHHKVGTEITVLVSGRARMCGRELVPGDILVLPPGTATAFEAFEDTVTAVVKVPSVPGDKYPGRPQEGSPL
ncbi:MAG: cupin domain-containing protein [Acidimicrobiales bacterium]